MIRLRKRLLLGSLGTVAVLLVVGLAAVLLLRSGWLREKIRERVVQEVERSTGGRAEIGQFDFSVSNLQVRIRSFVLHGTEASDELPFLRARSVVVGLKVISFLRRDIDIDLLAIEAPEVRIRIYEDGRTNIPSPKVKTGHRNPIEQFLALAIRRFRVEDGILQIQNRNFPLDIQGERLRSRLFYESTGPRYTGDLSVDQLTIGSAGLAEVAFDLNSQLAISNGRIELSSARIARNRSVLNFGAALESLEHPTVTFNFEGGIQLADVPRSIPLPLARLGGVNVVGTGSVSGASEYHVSGRIAGSGLALDRPEFRVRNAGLKASIDFAPGRIVAENLKVDALAGSFRGSARLEDSTRLAVEGAVSGVSLREVARARALDARTWSGSLSGPLQLEGTLTGSHLGRVRSSADIIVTAQTGELPMEGSVHVVYQQAAGTVELHQSYLATASSRVEFSGTFGRRLSVRLESGDLKDFLPVLTAFRPPEPPPLPVLKGGGRAAFLGTVTGPLEDPTVAGRVSLSQFEWNGMQFDRFESGIEASSSAFEAKSMTVVQNGATAQGSGSLALKDWRPSHDGALTGSLTVQGIALSQLLRMAGRTFPAEGAISARLQFAGTYGSPEVTASVRAAPFVLQAQRFDRASAEIRYARDAIRIPSAVIESGKTSINGNGSFTHPEDDWNNGSARFEIDGKDVALALVGNLARVPEGVDGRVTVQLRGEVGVEASQPKLKALQGHLSFSDLTLEGNPAGKATLHASTSSGRDLSVTVDAQVAGASVTGKSVWRLEGGYPGKGELQFTNLALSALRPWWRPEANGRELPFEARAQGGLTFSGALMDVGSWKGRAEVSTMEILPSVRSTGVDVFALRNDGPVVFSLEGGTLRIERARFTGTNTDLEATGSVLLPSKNNTLQLRFRGSVNLAILHNFERDLTASGVSTLDASIRGPIAKPEIYGRLELKDASFYFSGVPNGIDKARGVIFLFRDRATIEKVTAETGGGRVSLDGFVGFVGEPSIRLQANAEQVRVRYPEGFSTYMNASLNLTGTARRSLLSGKITILRSGVTPRSDFATLLTQSSKPMVTPATQNELLRNLQFDVRVQTAPDARFETTLTRDVQAEADLRLRGTPYKPVLLGHFSVTQGEINFLGNRYNINRGSVSFLNPARLEPLLNLDLETRVRGIDVTVTFTGPPNKLSVSYRSDPPLQPSEIIALLAVGRTPAGSPTVAARQSEQDQSWQQFGAATLVGQALAAPVAGRLQRFFGVSRIKIDPKLTGIENNPEARLTLEQQVSKDITFTYITNLTQTQEQIVRVEWNVNRQWSVLAVRDANGLFGIDFLYKKQFK